MCLCSSSYTLLGAAAACYEARSEPMRSSQGSCYCVAFSENYTQQHSLPLKGQGPHLGTGGETLYPGSTQPLVWAVPTLSQGYVVQFRCCPPFPGQIRMMVICDQVKTQALSQRMDALLAKGVIVPVDLLLDPGDFYSNNSIVPKKTVAFVQFWT